MQLSQTLDKLMQKNNVSAYKMSKDTGISDRLIGYWRSGEKLPGAENLLTIANYFGISVDYLLTGKENNQESSNAHIVPVLRQDYRDFKAENDMVKLYNRVCRSIYTLHSDLVASVLLSAIDLPANQPCEIDENKLKWLAIHSETSAAFFRDERAAKPNYKIVRKIADEYAREGVMSLKELKTECSEVEQWERNYTLLYSEAIRRTAPNEYIGEILDMFANCHSKWTKDDLMNFIRKSFEEFKEDQYSKMSKIPEARTSISIPIPKR